MTRRDPPQVRRDRAFAGVEKFLDTPVKRYSSGHVCAPRLRGRPRTSSRRSWWSTRCWRSATPSSRRSASARWGCGSKGGRTVLFVSHNMAPTPDVLFVAEPATMADGDSVAFLGAHLFNKDDVFGLWALGPETIEYLQRQLSIDKPRIVIECGAGLSTIWLAQYASRSSGDVPPARIVSLEQSAEEVERILGRLRSLGLDRYVSILHAPLDEDGNYRCDLDQILRATDHRRADWVLIDGPSGPPGCRSSTLPSLMPCCNDRARWYLDDAFRDAELDILKQWSGTPGIAVDGILPMPKGLATGTVRSPAETP
jgi:hypothetical protein